VQRLNDGLAQTIETGSNAQSAWSANFLIDLGSVQNIAQFNSYSWHSALRQDQGYTLYSSAAATPPNFYSTDPVGDGWTLVGSVATTYQDDTSLPHQVGVSMSGVGEARYLFVDVINGYNNGDTKYHGSFYGEFDVVLAVAAAADAATSTVDSSPATVANDGVSTSTITVTLNDADSSPVAGKTVTLASDRGGLDTISAASGPSNASGVVTFAVSSTTAGSPVFTATDTTDGVVVTDTASVTFTAGVVSAANSTVAASPASIAADGATTSTITVTLKDGSSNPVAGKTVILASDRGATDTISAASGSSNGSGVVTFTVTSTTVGDAVFTATDTTDGVVVAQTATVTFTAGAAGDANSTVSASPSSVPANGVNTSTITVTLQDSNGNPVAGNTVTLASNRGATDTISAASGPSNAAGEVTFTVSSFTLGNPVFTATDSTDAGVLTQTAAVSFTAPPSGAIVTHEALATTNTPVFVGFTTIPDISNSDYIDQLNGNGHTWTTLSNTAAVSDGGLSIATILTPAGGGVRRLNNGLAQTVESGGSSNSESSWSANYLIDLGSVQNVAEFNSYSWHSALRQDQGYTLYSSAAATAPNFYSTDPVGDGWTLAGSVATAYQDDTSLPHQVGVSMSGVGEARYLFVDVINGYLNGNTKYHGTFMSEFDVVVGGGGSSSPFAITEIDYNPDTAEVTLTWNSRPGMTYIARYSGDMTNWGADMGDGLTAVDDERPDDGDFITETFDLTEYGLQNLGDLFFRIDEAE
jgi:hypothetical protein